MTSRFLLVGWWWFVGAGFSLALSQGAQDDCGSHPRSHAGEAWFYIRVSYFEDSSGEWIWLFADDVVRDPGSNADRVHDCCATIVRRR